mgnify:CR=1 FL=1
MHQMILRITKETHDSLKEQAKARGQTLTGLIRQILWEWIEENKK